MMTLLLGLTALVTAVSVLLALDDGRNVIAAALLPGLIVGALFLTNLRIATGYWPRFHHWPRRYAEVRRLAALVEAGAMSPFAAQRTFRLYMGGLDLMMDPDEVLGPIYDAASRRIRRLIREGAWRAGEAWQ